ncbi:MAG: LLM class flavin-dependent oxidoreductase [Candidatus Thorarchaeota archaeon]|jgi:5,10-methylenetetrahydromethanopterin reductase
MKWGIALNVKDSISQTIEKSLIADRGGIDQVWITDFPALRYAPTVAAVIAEKTSYCRIGVGLVSPFLYSSSHIIQFMTTLIESHGERFDLLLGPGDRFALESIGIVNTPKAIVEKTKVALREVKRGLLESGHDCKVLLGAQGPKMIELSLKADGVLLNYSDLEMANWAVNQVRDKITDDFQVGLFPPAFIGHCEKLSDNPAISFSAAMVAIGLGRTVANLFELGSSLKTARMLLKERGGIDKDVVAAVGDDILKRFAFCGTQEQLQEYTEDLEKIGYTNVVFGPPIGMSKKGVENLISVKISS